MSSKKNKNKAKKAATAALQQTHSQIPPGEEMYALPVQPDRNTKMTRPASLAGKVRAHLPSHPPTHPPSHHPPTQ
jgi:hypothetical protein